MSLEATAKSAEEKSIAVSGQFGFVIRRRALAERNIPFIRLVTDVFEGAYPIAATENLLSFGAQGGSATAFELSDRLLNLGLEYFDDFYEIALAVPRWCELRARYTLSDPPGRR